MEVVNTNFKVIGLTRLRIKPKSTVPEADALTARPSKLLNSIRKFPVWSLVQAMVKTAKN